MNRQFGECLQSMAGPDRYGDITEGRRIKEALALDAEKGPTRIERNGATWRAIKAKIKDMQDGDYLPSLRNKNVDYPDTQYARGAIDALERLLEFAGEDI